MENSISLNGFWESYFVKKSKETTVRPERVLWLTDTYGDHNGVSMVLQAVYKEIRERNLPIDILLCSDTLVAQDNLLVVKPILEFYLPFYRQQPLRVPNYFKLHKLFRQKNYTRIISSTEGPVGLSSIFLKRFYKVHTFFYLHTDWMMFGKQVLNLKARGLRWVERIMRFYYHQYDKVFVLNTDQQKWLTSAKMRFKPEQVFLTAHWTESIFSQWKPLETQDTPLKKSPVILFAGRLSPEKGIFELPELFRKAKQSIPDLKMIIAGTGPSEEALKDVFPEAEFTGWILHSRLPEIYASADLLILPSQFDTFSCVVLEALSCGLPVVAYNTKGPKDIIQESVNGFLVNSPEEMLNRLLEYFSDETLQASFKMKAVDRAQDYTADKILKQMMSDINLKNFEVINEVATA